MTLNWIWLWRASFKEYFFITLIFILNRIGIAWSLLNTPTASLQRGKTHPPKSVLDMNTKQSDGDTQVQQLGEMWSTPSLPSLPDQLRPGEIAPDRRWPWCNGYRRWKWTRRHEFKSWTRLIVFHIALIPLGKVWIQLFSLQLWVNSRTD